MIDDLPDDSPPPCCPSCGVAYVDHLGLHGTCAALVEARATIESMPLHFLGWLGVDPDGACPRCQGIGRRGYGSTSTWRGGAGGQAMTVGVCDHCWGSGTVEPWPSLRVQAAEVQQLRAQVERLATNATAREGVMRREGDLLRASQREADTLRAACSSALCMLVEGPDVLEPGQSAREAKAILSAALNPKEKP